MMKGSGTYLKMSPWWCHWTLVYVESTYRRSKMCLELHYTELWWWIGHTIWKLVQNNITLVKASVCLERPWFILYWVVRSHLTQIETSSLPPDEYAFRILSSSQSGVLLGNWILTIRSTKLRTAHRNNFDQWNIHYAQKLCNFRSLSLVSTEVKQLDLIIDNELKSLVKSLFIF